MATAVVAPPAPPPTPVLTAATPLGIPSWTQEPTGTWYVRIAFADSSDPLNLSELSAMSNELSFVVDNAPNGVTIINWTAVAGYVVVFFLSQTPGSYFDANGHVALQPSPLQLAGNGFGAGDVNSVSGFTIISAGNGQPFAVQNVTPDLVSSLAPGPYAVSGGTGFDRVGTQDIVDAINLLPGESVTEFQDAGAAGTGFDMARNVYLLERGITFDDGFWELKNEALYMRGSLIFGPTPSAGVVRVEMGERTGDGSRHNGPEIGFMVRPASVVGAGVADVSWEDPRIEMFSARIVSLHTWLGADVGGVDPDPANDWVRGALPHGFATLVDPPSGFLWRMNSALTSRFQSCRFEGWGVASLVRGVPGGTLDMDDIVGIDMAEFVQSFDATIAGIRIENAADGFALRTVTGTAKPVLDLCRVVSRTVSDLNFRSTIGSGEPGKWRILDCIFDEAADNNDPLTELGSLTAVTDKEILFAHRFDLQVVDFAGAAVAGAGVDLIHVETDASVFDVTTGAGGRIATQIVDRDRWVRDTGTPSGPALLSAHEAAGYIENLLGPPFRLVVTVPGRAPFSVIIDPDRPLSYVVTTPARAQDDLRIEVAGTIPIAAEVGPLGLAAVFDPSQSDVEVDDPSIGVILE